MKNGKNDNKILELRKQIQEKKVTLEDKTRRFAPITNCSLELDGIRVNLQVISKNQLMLLLLKLNLLIMSAENLKISDEIIISDYTVNEWITDIKNRINNLTIKEEQLHLKSLENKLNVLLSNEKKTELEIDEIANLLSKSS